MKTMDKNEDSPELNKKIPYREVIGCLQYLTTATSQTFAVGVIGCAVSKSIIADLIGVELNIFLYLRSITRILAYFIKSIRSYLKHTAMLILLEIGNWLFYTCLVSIHAVEIIIQ